MPWLQDLLPFPEEEAEPRGFCSCAWLLSAPWSPGDHTRPRMHPWARKEALGLMASQEAPKSPHLVFSLVNVLRLTCVTSEGL